MQINPREQLLAIWSSIARHSVTDGKWNWGPHGGRSSVEDAERLLCLMYPATEIPAFQLSDPDLMQKDVADVLKALGGRLRLPEVFCGMLREFTATHTADDGSPGFCGGSYFTSRDPGQEPTARQRALGVVDSFSMSITLCLATLGFLKDLAGRGPWDPVGVTAAELKEAAQARLTAAMVGLLRSFTVNVFDAESERGRQLCALLGQDKVADRVVLEEFQRRFGSLRATIRDHFDLGTDVLGSLDQRNQLFECGWTWGVVRDAAPVPAEEHTGPQPEGCAAAVPSPYFTVVALDGIVDLFSDRTLKLGLLTPDQQRLAEALRLRRQVAQQYWSGIARFLPSDWPLADIPWRMADDGPVAEYHTLSVTSILVHGLARERTADDDLPRVVDVLQRLAERGRVTSRMTRDARTALRLHTPGIALPLEGSELLGPPLSWTVNDFSAQLLKRTVQLCVLGRTLPAQGQLLRLAEQTMEHLWRRRRRDGTGAGLWDDVRGVHPGAPQPAEPSWGLTERVVEAMVAASLLLAQQPIRSVDLVVVARDLISEAGHLLGVERQGPSVRADGAQGLELAAIESRLRRAGRIAEEKPGTAAALALHALADLDALARARQSALGGG
ncbi:SCO2524 family protein [Streptomyces sp. NPDC086549]|uniref:SCO2524 family protein n=1 Tax=Streptomyces sp. NPDC086549 TaxID=3365752 RepID=UPI00381F3B78